MLHLVLLEVYDWMIPPELGAPRPWVTVSGVAELATAALVAVPATRRAGGWAAAGLLTAFMPAHLHTFRVIPKKPLPMAVAARPAAAAGPAGARRAPGRPGAA